MIGFVGVFGTILILCAICYIFLWLADWGNDDRAF